MKYEYDIDRAFYNDFELGPNQKEWLKSLESGKYRQCTQYLKLNDGYCCLGVACDIFDNLNSRLDDEYGYEYFECDGETEVAPVSVVNKLALRGQAGDFYNTRIYNSVCLAALNDEGWTFQMIAALIRNYPSLVFSESV